MKLEIILYIKEISDNEQAQKLLIETVGKVLLKQDDIELFKKENENKIIHIRDWILSTVKNNEEWKQPRVLTIDALNNAADKYFERKNNKLKTIELDETHEKLIADLSDYYIVQMLTPESLDNESKIMHHCIGHGYYDMRLYSNDYQYLSFRDKFNKAHVTMEIRNKEIIQIQGKQNKIPEQKYLDLLIPWLIKNNYKLDLSKFDFVYNKNDDKVYSIFELPDNCEVDAELNLSCVEIEKLPDNLVVNGSLDLWKNKTIKILPNNLTVKNLSLEHTKIKELPDNIKIKDILVLSYSDMKKLPDNLECKTIYIEKSQKNLIKDTMKFEQIIVDNTTVFKNGLTPAF